MFSRKIITLALYLLIVILIFTTQPSLMFNSNGEMKSFGYYNNDKTTIMPVILFLPILALILFIAVLIIECINT
jgi:hypothetical protein